MLALQFSDIHQSPLRKTVFLEQLSNKFNAAECWHLHARCFPVLDQITQQAQVIVFSTATLRLG